MPKSKPAQYHTVFPYFELLHDEIKLSYVVDGMIVPTDDLHLILDGLKHNVICTDAMDLIGIAAMQNGATDVKIRSGSFASFKYREKTFIPY